MSTWKIAVLGLAAIWGGILLWFVVGYAHSCRAQVQEQKERTK